MPGSYGAILLLGAIAAGLGLVILLMTVVLGPRAPSPVKQSTYESGLVPIGSARRRVPVRYYLVAVLFILFDIEAIYLYPWAVEFRELSAPPPAGLGYGALVSMAVFLSVLMVGFVYVWRKGALEWR